jgi:hypothetical protein
LHRLLFPGADAAQNVYLAKTERAQRGLRASCLTALPSPRFQILEEGQR